MERPGVSLWWFPLFLFAVLSSAAAQNEPVYTAVNGTIRLKPESSGPFTNILWKHKGDLVVEWVNNELDYYGMFKDRATLDIKTGGLVIKNTDDSFTGPYTVELNSSVQPKGYEVVFIKEVNKPEVDVKPLACTPELKDCTLVCLHYDTNAFGPLTFSWREGDGDWKQGDKEMPINDVKNQGIKTFSCRVKNPISLAESVPHKNPFYKEPDPPSPVVGIVLGLIGVVGVLVAGGGFAWWKGKLTFLPENLQRGHGAMNLPADKNGDAQLTGEGQPLQETSSPNDDANNPPPVPNDITPADPSTLTEVATS